MYMNTHVHLGILYQVGLDFKTNVQVFDLYERQKAISGIDINTVSLY